MGRLSFSGRQTMKAKKDSSGSATPRKRVFDVLKDLVPKRAPGSVETRETPQERHLMLHAGRSAQLLGLDSALKPRTSAHGRARPPPGGHWSFRAWKISRSPSKLHAAGGTCAGIRC